MLDGHGFFALPAALDDREGHARVPPALDGRRPPSRQHRAMAEFRAGAGVPIAVSEMLVMRDQYRQVLERHAADYVMIDPTWVGGISESRRIAELAQLYNIPVLMHDCTGPLTLMAGLNIAAAVPGVTYQECVRAHIASMYPSLIDTQVVVQSGQIELSQRPGLGTRWLPELFANDAPTYRITRLEHAG